MTKRRLPYPGREKLEELLNNGLSVAKIAHDHGVSAQTGHRWMVKAGLKDPLPSDEPDAERFKSLVKPSSKQAQKEQTPEPEQVYEESAPLGASPELKNLAPANHHSDPQISPNQGLQSPQIPDEDLTAFDRLSNNQKKAAMLVASVESEDLSLTNEQLAELCSVNGTTIGAWKRDPVFMAAVMELFDPVSKPAAYLLVVKDLVTRVQSGRATSDDRRLLAEYSGVIKGEQSVVNVAVALDTDLGRRFKQVL